MNWQLSGSLTTGNATFTPFYAVSYPQFPDSCGSASIPTPPAPPAQPDELSWLRDRVDEITSLVAA